MGKFFHHIVQKKKKKILQERGYKRFFFFFFPKKWGNKNTGSLKPKNNILAPVPPLVQIQSTIKVHNQKICIYVLSLVLYLCSFFATKKYLSKIFTYQSHSSSICLKVTPSFTTRRRRLKNNMLL